MHFIDALKTNFGFQNKDIITLLLSSIAFIVAFFTFLFNIYQKLNDNKRVIRKELTDIIKELVEVNLAFTKLEIDNTDKPINNLVIEQKRTYNSRRRYLLEHGEFLVRKIPKLATDIDFVVLGNACLFNGFTEKGILFWKKAICKAKTDYMTAVNKRGLASRLFLAEKMEEGRGLFKEAIECLSKNKSNNEDFNFDAIADTWLMWSRAEYDIENYTTSANLFNNSILSIEKIKNIGIKNRALNRIQANLYLKNSANNLQSSGSEFTESKNLRDPMSDAFCKS